MWFPNSIQAEIQVALDVLDQIEDCVEKVLLQIVLSRAVRSSRATKHYDLGTLVEPNFLPYYCKKHFKICKPLVTMQGWFRRYAKDTFKRVTEFESLRTNADQICLQGDSRTIDIQRELDQRHSRLASEVRNKKISGIITSPPYVGLIDYHEQHAYAYELFGLERADQNEIGPLPGGAGKQAQLHYIQGIAAVLNTCKRFLAKDFSIYLVVNDKFKLYEEFSARANLQICQEFKRPVLNRAEGNKGFYSESIFLLKAG